MSQARISTVAKQFDIPGDFLHAEPYGSGHINDTFVAAYEQRGARRRYIIQRINHNIFKDPEALMRNFVLVTAHIYNKLKQKGTDDLYRRVLTVIPSVDGNNYYKDSKGNYWRALNFIDNARTYDVCKSLRRITEAGRAFGNFQYLLEDLSANHLYETIPGFHNGPKRFENFKKALKENKCGRAAAAQKESDFLMKHSPILDILPGLAEEGGIPLRVTHNDTKVNNIMFDNTTGKALCVIDLDTVMPGLSLWDFGDIVRTTISEAEEDEKDLSKVAIDIRRFEAAVAGFVSSAGVFLNKTERANLLVGAKTIILEQAVRFLTDHLAGDTYYKIRRQNHNLDRCRTQITLYELILRHTRQLCEIINRIVSRVTGKI